MKNVLLLFILLVFSYHLSAQRSMYVRIYDLNGKKTNKGHLVATTDSTLIIEKDKNQVTIPVANIGNIKTKHSIGNNFLIGSSVGATFLVIVGILSANPDEFLVGYTASQGALAGLIFGAPMGAAIGGITALLKNSKTFIINGNPEKLKEFMKLMDPNTHAVN